MAASFAAALLAAVPPEAPDSAAAYCGRFLPPSLPEACPAGPRRKTDGAMPESGRHMDAC